MQNSSQFFSNSLMKGHNWNRGVIEKYVKNDNFEVPKYVLLTLLTIQKIVPKILSMYNLRGHS